MQIPSLRAKRRARIEIIPLIDIIFFLLATFMMVSLSMIQNHALNVHLPMAATGAPQERNDSVSLSVTEDGQYAWNKETVTLDDLIARLHQLKAGNPDPKIFIHGDGQARFTAVIALLDEARKAGIGKVAIETLPKGP
ncbi:MAG: biopolymer transporter ExbD [Methylacidiphilales bacterium]|nr:biopolymer transporter ExbD [Candidatus Methylacidiphilales bacterium]